MNIWTIRLGVLATLCLTACDDGDADPDVGLDMSADGTVMDGEIDDALPRDAFRDAGPDAGANECNDDDDCPARMFCELPLGVCASGNPVGICTVRPDGCTEEVDPVCGCDGQTYSNDCNRQQAGVSGRAAGACPPACEPGASREFECPDGSLVPECICGGDGVWQCTDSPEQLCRDGSCDDGTMPICPLPEPECEDSEIAAVIGGCWSCVNPATCRAWGEPGCSTDADCGPEARCDECASGSCPVCEDCVAGCRPHDCPTEAELVCDAERPDCGEGGVAVIREGCWSCVDQGTCEAALQCVAEGEMGPVVPDAPMCCEGLSAIGCDQPSPDGGCLGCDGAIVCTECGDGDCGPGENRCNCPRDCAPAMGECRVPRDCIPRFWNIRCLGHWSCDAGRCQEVCDLDRCGDGRCDQDGGESRTSCRADCENTPECARGATTEFRCPGGELVPWCSCVEGGWSCAPDPAARCRDTRCDDGTDPICDQIPPVCEPHEIFAHQNQCYRCVNPVTCLPWGENACSPRQPCPANERCDDCATSSCPECDDCIAACVSR